MRSPSATCHEFKQTLKEYSELGDVTLEHESIFNYRREKGFAAAAAVADVLQRRRPLNGGEDEFLSIWRWVKDHQDQRTAIHSDP